MTPRQEDQSRIVFEALKKRPATMLMISNITGVDRANICRYVASFRKSNRIAVVTVKPCAITKHRAGYYTTDENLFPAKTQMQLWS
jgi:hypothetical protein